MDYVYIYIYMYNVFEEGGNHFVMNFSVVSSNNGLTQASSVYTCKNVIS